MADSPQSLRPLRNHSVASFPSSSVLRKTQLSSGSYFVFSLFFFSLSLFICGTPFRPSLFPVPLLNSLPGDLRPLDELYAQKLKYKAISEELDHALNDMTSLWEGAGVPSYVLAIPKLAFSLWCLHFPWASRSSFPASWFGLSSLPLLCLWLCDWNKDRRSLCPGPHFHFLHLPLLSRSCDALDGGYNRKWVVQMGSSFQKENNAHVMLCAYMKTKANLAWALKNVLANYICTPIAVFP